MDIWLRCACETAAELDQRRLSEYDDWARQLQELVTRIDAQAKQRDTRRLVP